MFVVAGVSGNTGSVVASTLLDAGKKVRVLVRSSDKGESWAGRGAEVVVGALDDANVLGSALRGSEGVYLLSPPDLRSKNFLAERRVFLDAVATAVSSAKPGHVVFLSSVGAQHADGTGPVRSVHHAERALRATGLPCTFVRASYFVENWAAMIPVAKRDGVLPSFIKHDQKMPMVGTRDIGEIAARALLDGPKGQRFLELAGPIDVTPDDVAQALRATLGRAVNVAEAPLEAVVPTFTSFGISEDVSKLYAELFAALRSGKLSWEGPAASVVRGRISLVETLRQFS
jgi:uncharacterized protein YbjT (DUF2867 family)